MRRFAISVRGKAREQYIVEAEEEEVVRWMFKRGVLPKPVITEVYDSEIVSMDEIPA